MRYRNALENEVKSQYAAHHQGRQETRLIDESPANGEAASGSLHIASLAWERTGNSYEGADMLRDTRVPSHEEFYSFPCIPLESARAHEGKGGKGARAKQTLCPVGGKISFATGRIHGLASSTGKERWVDHFHG